MQTVKDSLAATPARSRAAQAGGGGGGGGGGGEEACAQGRQRPAGASVSPLTPTLSPQSRGRRRKSSSGSGPAIPRFAPHLIHDARVSGFRQYPLVSRPPPGHNHPSPPPGAVREPVPVPRRDGRIRGRPTQCRTYMTDVGVLAAAEPVGAREARRLKGELVGLLRDAVESGASVGFLLPLADDEAAA